MLAGDFYVKYLFIAGVDRLSLAWGGGELVMRKGGLLSMEICPSPLKEVHAHVSRSCLLSGLLVVLVNIIAHYLTLLSLPVCNIVDQNACKGAYGDGSAPPMHLIDAAQTPIKLGKRGRDDSDGGSGAEDEGRPRRCVLPTRWSLI